MKRKVSFKLTFFLQIRLARENPCHRMVGWFSTGGDIEQEGQQDKKTHFQASCSYSSCRQVQWSVFANHAGGYSYRLCKMPHGGIKQLTEECFQVLFSCSKAVLKIVNEVPYLEYGCKHLNMIIWVPKEMPLKFAGEHQWVIYNEVIAFEIWIIKRGKIVFLRNIVHLPRTTATIATRSWPTGRVRELSHPAPCKMIMCFFF